MRREIPWQQKDLSSWPVRSSAVASPSPVARSVPVSVTVSPVRPTSRAYFINLAFMALFVFVLA
jgi:hypothetical protein